MTEHTIEITSDYKKETGKYILPGYQEEYVDWLEKKAKELKIIKANIPTTEKMRKARQNYNKRAYSGHFAGDEPWKHFHAGVEWLLNELHIK